MAVSESADSGERRPPLRAVVDTNVVLDLVLGRESWASQARPMWAARDAKRLEAYLPASVLTDIFYICRKQIGADRAKLAVEECLRRFTILPLDRMLLEAALALPGPDFEDNVQIACARASGLDLIVTRDLAGFADAPIPAVEPSNMPAYLRS
ncbi:MAG TPA: PIN domain-containing protein [Ktedonobacterales bacterium]|nr:PIN domain-containing protein [Ktedonobacterales bacterium]